MNASPHILGFLGWLLCGAAEAAPGQAGWVYPAPTTDGRTGDRTGESWTARAGIGGGYAFLIDEAHHGVTFVEAAVQPTPGVQIAGAFSLQADGHARLDPAYLVVSATVPWDAPTKLAFVAGAGGLGRYSGAGVGLSVGNQRGRVGWDIGWLPLVISVHPKWGWAELQGGDKTPAWDLHSTWMTLHGGLTFGMSERWSLRVGAPDGLVFSYATRRFYFDVGGGGLVYLAGAVGVKMGGRF
jgi:hypothetical protein